MKEMDKWVQVNGLNPDYYNNLTKSDCIRLYTSTIFAHRTNLVFVTNDTRGQDYKNTVLSIGFVDGAWRHNTGLAYLCKASRVSSDECFGQWSKASIDSWTLRSQKMKYCLSQNRPEQNCELDFSPTIMMGIVVRPTSLYYIFS